MAGAMVILKLVDLCGTQPLSLMDWEALCMAHLAGLEPAASPLGGVCSIPLSYRCKIGAGTEAQTRLTGVEAQYIDLLCYTRVIS
jgi:hypothetical protein